MDETVRQIEAQIGRTRDRLGSNFKELEEKVETATDWREQFRARPYVGLGLACVSGLLLATVLRRNSFGAQMAASSDANTAHRLRQGFDARGQALDLWDNIREALVGVGATRLRQYIGELIPGFEEHFQQVEQRSGRSFQRTTSGR